MNDKTKTKTKDSAECNDGVTRVLHKGDNGSFFVKMKGNDDRMMFVPFKPKKQNGGLGANASQGHYTNGKSNARSNANANAKAKEALRFATWGEQNENRRNYQHRVPTQITNTDYQHRLPTQSKNKKEEEDELEKLVLMDENYRFRYGLPERRTKQEEKELHDIKIKYWHKKHNFMTIDEQTKYRILSDKGRYVSPTLTDYKILQDEYE